MMARVLEESVKDITVVAFFLLYMEKEGNHEVFGTWSVGEAVDSFARLLGKRPRELRALIESNEE